MYSFGILRGFVASYLELRILVFLMEALSKKKVGGVASKSKKQEENCVVKCLFII